MTSTKPLFDASALAEALDARTRNPVPISARKQQKILDDAIDLANRLLRELAPPGIGLDHAGCNVALTAISMIAARLIVTTSGAEADLVSAGITDFLGALLANSNDYIIEEFERRRLN